MGFRLNTIRIRRQGGVRRVAAAVAVLVAAACGLTVAGPAEEYARVAAPAETPPEALQEVPGNARVAAPVEPLFATEGQTSAPTYRMEVTIHGVAGCDDGTDRAEYYVRIERDSAEDRAALQTTEDAALQVVGGRGSTSDDSPQEILRSLERRRAASDLVPLNEAERRRFEQLRGAQRDELTDDEVEERRLLAGRGGLSAIEARQLELLQRLDARAAEQRRRLRMFAGFNSRGRRNSAGLLDYLHVQAGESMRIALFEVDAFSTETCLRTTTTLGARTLERGSEVIEHEGRPALTLRFSK